MIGFQDRFLLIAVLYRCNLLCFSLGKRAGRSPYITSACMCIPSPARVSRPTCVNGGRANCERSPRSLGSVKGRSDFALCCAVSSIVLSVRALPPPSPFSPCFFFLFSIFSPLGRAQVDGRAPLLLSDAPGSAHQKKKFPDSHQATLSPLPASNSSNN